MTTHQSPLKQITGLPDTNVSPTVPAHLDTLVSGVESKLWMHIPTRSQRPTYIPTPSVWMVTVIDDEQVVEYYNGSAWCRLWPPLSGSGAPSSQLGANGDVYYQTS